MLVLTRRLGEEIVIDGDIRVTVVAVRGEQVRLGITAPKCVSVDRAEVHARRGEFLEVFPRLPARAVPVGR
jgi:carbon storage regulator